MSDLPTSASAANERATSPAHRTGAEYPGTPRWVKMGAIVAGVLVVLLLLVMIISGGEHGPLRHIPSSAGTLPVSAVEVTL